MTINDITIHMIQTAKKEGGAESLVNIAIVLGVAKTKTQAREMKIADLRKQCETMYDVIDRPRAEIDRTIASIVQTAQVEEKKAQVVVPVGDVLVTSIEVKSRGFGSGAATKREEMEARARRRRRNKRRHRMHLNQQRGNGGNNNILSREWMKHIGNSRHVFTYGSLGVKKAAVVV